MSSLSKLSFGPGTKKLCDAQSAEAFDPLDDVRLTSRVHLDGFGQRWRDSWVTCLSLSQTGFDVKACSRSPVLRDGMSLLEREESTRERSYLETDMMSTMATGSFIEWGSWTPVPSVTAQCIDASASAVTASRSVISLADHSLGHRSHRSSLHHRQNLWHVGSQAMHRKGPMTCRNGARDFSSHSEDTRHRLRSWNEPRSYSNHAWNGRAPLR